MTLTLVGLGVSMATRHTNYTGQGGETDEVQLRGTPSYGHPKAHTPLGGLVIVNMFEMYGQSSRAMDALLLLEKPHTHTHTPHKVFRKHSIEVCSFTDFSVKPAFFETSWRLL